MKANLSLWKEIKKRERLRSIKDFEVKSGCPGENSLAYGTAPE